MVVVRGPERNGRFMTQVQYHRGHTGHHTASSLAYTHIHRLQWRNPKFGGEVNSPRLAKGYGGRHSNVTAAQPGDCPRRDDALRPLLWEQVTRRDPRRTTSLFYRLHNAEPSLHIPRRGFYYAFHAAYIDHNRGVETFTARLKGCVGRWGDATLSPW